MLKEKDFQTRNKILAKIPIMYESRLKIISDMQDPKTSYLSLGSYGRMGTTKMKKIIQGRRYRLYELGDPIQVKGEGNS